MAADMNLGFSSGMISSVASIELAHFISSSLALLILYQCLRIAYSIFYGPLSKIPGPKIAAITSLYEIYYDSYKPGLYWQVIKNMHRKYGPIVQISPNEVHIDDPDYYNKIYNNTGRWNKDSRSERQFFAPGSIASTAVHEVHKGRRSLLNSYFSRSSIEDLQPTMKWHLEKMCCRIKEYKEEGRPVPINNAMASLSADIVTNYLMPQPYYLLDTPDFSPSYFNMMRAVDRYSQTAKNLPRLHHLLELLPKLVGRFASPIGTINIEDQDFVENQIAMFDRDPEAFKLPDFRYFEGSPNEKGAEMPPPLANGFVIDQLLHKQLPGPPSRRSFKQLAQEFQVLIGAASDQVHLVLGNLIYYSHAEPRILNKIKTEFEEHNINGENLPGFRELEKLPYLNAAINEALRIAVPVVSRLNRVAPDRDLFYKDYLIPAGVSISMSMADLHLNEDLFPDPMSFIPERWLGPEAATNKRNLVPFSRGSRNCIGLNLANAEMLLIAAAMFTRFEMQLYETTVDDVRFQHDFFAPMARLGSLGVRVKIQ